MPWKFRTYVSENGRNDVQAAVNDASKKVILELEVRLRYLANEPIIDWHEPQAKKLSGVDSIYEIRFKADRVQWRPLGFFIQEDNVFVILVWANHKGRVYVPADAIRTAEKRRGYVRNGPATTVPLQIDGEDF